MNTIGYAQLRKLVEGATRISGKFPAHGAKPSGEELGRAGFQLTFSREVALRAGRKVVGSRVESHTVTFGVLSDAPPATHLHASYGMCEAFKTLFLAELKRAEKSSDIRPIVTLEPAFWGQFGERAATFRVEAGDEYEAFAGQCHSLRFGEMHTWLTLAGCDAESAQRYGNAQWWAVLSDGSDNDTHRSHEYSQFDWTAPKEAEAV